METKNNCMCPWWMGYLLLIPIRKYSHNPVKILIPEDFTFIPSVIFKYMKLG